MPRSFSWGARQVSEGGNYIRLTSGTLLVSKRNKQNPRWSKTFIFQRGGRPRFQVIPWESIAVYISRRGPTLKLLYAGEIWHSNARDWAVPRQNSSKKAQK